MVEKISILWHTYSMKAKTALSLCTFAVLIVLCITSSHSCKEYPFFADEDADIRLATDKTEIKLNEKVIVTVMGYNPDGSYLWDKTRVDFFIENGTLDKTYVELKDGKAEISALADKNTGEMKISARSGSSFAKPNPLTIKINP